MQWGEKGPALYGTELRLRRETDTRTPCVIESLHSSKQRPVPLASLRSARVLGGFRPSF
jgi:hypothetical protein